MRIIDWSSDVCSSDLCYRQVTPRLGAYDALAEPLLEQVPSDAEDPGPAGATLGVVPAALLPRLREGLRGEIRCSVRAVRAPVEVGEHPGVVPVVERSESLGVTRGRSEERRVGEEWVSTVRTRWPPEHKK